MRITGVFFQAIALVLYVLPLMGCKDANKEQLPVDFVWDRVACEECKMALSDPHYSAQVIAPNGRAYFFDDIGCAILWLQRQPWKDKARIWVNDVNTSKWIAADQAHWLYGDPKTPMGYGFAATLTPVDNALTWKTVTQWMAIGKNLVNENLAKRVDEGARRSDAAQGPAGSPGRSTEKPQPVEGAR